MMNVLDYDLCSVNPIGLQIHSRDKQKHAEHGGQDEEGIREKCGCRYLTVYLRIKKKIKREI